MLQAFLHIHKQLPDWELQLVGPIAKEFEKYKEMYFQEHPEMLKCVTFTGEIIDQKILKEKYKQAKIFVMSSRWESFGLVSLEAMQYGCYFIGSDIAPFRDVTKQGELGTLCPIDDVNAFADCMKTIANDEVRMQKICDSAPRFVREEWDWSNVVDEIQDKLDKRLAGIIEMNASESLWKEAYSNLNKDCYLDASIKLLQGLNIDNSKVQKNFSIIVHICRVFFDRIDKIDGFNRDVLQRILLETLIKSLKIRANITEINDVYNLYSRFVEHKTDEVQRMGLAQWLGTMIFAVIRRLAEHAEWNAALKSLQQIEGLNIQLKGDELLLAAEICRKTGQKDAALRYYQEACVESSL